MRNPTKYTLQESIGWEEFEDVCCSFLYTNGYKNIKKAGKVSDGGRDAVVFVDKKEGEVFQFSKEKEPLKSDSSKFWREYKKWKDNDEVKEFIFVSTQDLGSEKIDLQMSLRNPSVEFYDITNLVNFLDYEPDGKDIKKNYAIFDKDLQEVFGADDRLHKLSEVAEVVNQDKNYDVITLLAEQQKQVKIPGVVFSSHSGNATQFFIPKSKENFDKATPKVNFKLVVPNTAEGTKLLKEYKEHIRRGTGVVLPPTNIKDLQFRLGEKLIFDGGDKEVAVELKPLDNDDVIVNHIFRSKRNKDIFIKANLHPTRGGIEEVLLDNVKETTPLDFSLLYIPGEQTVRLNYAFHLDRCLDAHEAYIYMRFLNELSKGMIEVIIEDSGIERSITDLPGRDDVDVPKGYLDILRKLDAIQQYFKIRVPSPLKGRLSETDIWSIQKLDEIITNGQTNIAVKHVSFAVSESVAEDMKKQQNPDGTLAVVFSAEEAFEPITILNTTGFATFMVVLPKAKFTATPQTDGTVMIDVEVEDDSAYLKVKDD